MANRLRLAMLIAGADIMAAEDRVVDGTRAWAQRDPRRADHHRWCNRHRVDQGEFPERFALKEQGGIVDPDAIAEAYWQLHRQPRSAWTQEMDLRPWSEPW
jgi:hypothetical protein